MDNDHRQATVYFKSAALAAIAKDLLQGAQVLAEIKRL
jgi:hypothetical protein